MAETNNWNEVSKLQNKVVSLQEEIIKRDKTDRETNEKGNEYLYELVGKIMEKSETICKLEEKLMECRLVMARIWNCNIEEVEKRVKSNIEELDNVLNYAKK